MDTKTFLGTVLGNAGYYCITGIEELHGEKRDPYVEQKFFDNLDDAYAQAVAFDDAGRNAYFALATFQEEGSRRNQNVNQLKSFFLDLDCGASKDYDTQSEALTALRGFCKELKLPKPTLVNSGRGVHVYWALVEPVSRETWLPVAERLKELCVDNGLFADPAVTSDSARVLRVPTTHNHKDTPAKLVEFIGEIAPSVTFESFRDLLGVSPFAKKRAYTPREIDPIMQKLMGSYVSKFKTIMMKTVDGTGCGQLKWIAENQETMPEPMWRAGLSIASFCVDRDKAIHKISQRHPDYSPDATEYKASQVRGPYSCETFNKYNPNICTSCSHWGKIKNPLALGRELNVSEDEVIVEEKVLDIPNTPLQTFVIPKYPEPYRRGANGGIFKAIEKDGDVVEVPVYHNDLYVVSRLRDPEIGEALVMRLHLPRDGVREFTLPLTAVGAKEEFRRYMSMHGVAVMKIDEIMAYVTKWVNGLQMTTAATEARRQFGWTDDAATSFVLGNMEIFGEHIAVNPPSSNTAGLFPAFVPRGTLEKWKETINFYNRPGFESFQYMFGISFGSPLVHFLPLNGMLYHMHSKESGMGKTTAMYAGASVWGNPEALVTFERDTFASKMNRAEIYKNLPFYSDELTNTAPKDLSDFAYQLSHGLQRNRLSTKGNVERVRGTSWKMLCGTSGNTGYLERVSAYKALPQAEAQRVLEDKPQRMTFSSKAETDDFSAAIRENYGHAGIIYIQYIIRNRDAVVDLLKATQIKIDQKSGMKAENRFWSAQTACVLTGMLISNKLGLTNFDVSAMFKWMVNKVGTAAQELESIGGDVESILTDYLAEHYNNVLRITSTQDLRKDANNIEKAILPEASPRISLIARYEYDVKKMYLLPKPLRDWCVKHQLNFASLIDGLKAGKTNAKRVKMRLGKGTHVNLPATDVWMLDFSEFMDDEKEQTLAVAATLFGQQDASTGSDA